MEWERRKSERRQPEREVGQQKNRKQRKGRVGEERSGRRGVVRDLACSMHSLGLELHCL